MSTSAHAAVRVDLGGCSRSHVPLAVGAHCGRYGCDGWQPGLGTCEPVWSLRGCLSFKAEQVLYWRTRAQAFSLLGPVHALSRRSYWAALVIRKGAYMSPRSVNERWRTVRSALGSWSRTVQPLCLIVLVVGAPADATLWMIMR